jgi:hypothetical protein
MYTHDNTSKCQIEQEILAEKEKLRETALSQPTFLAGQLFMEQAVEVQRQLDRHQDNCGLCLAALKHRGELSWSAFVNPTGLTRPATAERA